MSECLNAVGFVFNSVKTYIKKDNNNKYSRYYCQECAWIDKNKIGHNNPIPGYLSQCSKCTNNSQYKICIFKLKKENFISSSLNIATSNDDAWEEFKKNIIYQRNGNFVISVTKNNKLHSFYANMIKAKKCKCCEAILLYFKYNIISMLSCYSQFMEKQITQEEINPYQIYSIPYNTVCANICSNITYDLKSCEYQNVKFFISPNYTFTNSLQNNN